MLNNQLIMSQSKEHQNRNTINTTIDKPKK
jgi:hypothetical protein